MIEMLTYDFMNDTKTSAELVLNWEKKQFPVKIEFDVDKIVMDNAAKELKGAVGFNDIGFSSAAAYALQNNLDLNQALKWTDQAIASRAVWDNFVLKSNILKQMGKTAEADKVLNDAMNANATNLELNIYGYQLLNAKNYDKAIEVLTIDTKRFPTDPNTFDSLGEAYALKGDKKNAIVNFKKSLSMNPNAATKANSEKYLQQLGGK